MTQQHHSNGIKDWAIALPRRYRWTLTYLAIGVTINTCLNLYLFWRGGN